MSSYCAIAPGHPYHGPYHDSEYGYPTRDEAALFERLVLEMNQAGLSWLTILKKRDRFRQAFRGFDVERVARFGARDRARLLGHRPQSLEDRGGHRERTAHPSAANDARFVRGD